MTEDTLPFEKRLLISRAGRIGRIPFLLVGVLAAVFLLPPFIELLGIAALLVLDYKILKARQKEVAPTVEALLEVLSPHDVEAIIKSLGRGRLGADPSVQISEKVQKELQKSQAQESCAGGHALGCRHKPLKEKESWPGVLQEAVRKGNEIAKPVVRF